jgi:hypothetical protein
MQLKMVIVDLEISQQAKWRVLRIAAPALLLLSAGVAYAASNAVHSWKTGDQLNAADLNSSFAAVSVVSSGANSITVNGVFCGSTPATTGVFVDPTPGGNAVGYRAGKLQCERVAACSGSPATAHICDASEMVRSLQLGVLSQSIPIYWYASGTYNYNVAQGSADSNCKGYQNGTSDVLGSIYISSGGIAGSPAYGQPYFATCDYMEPIACCR